METNKNYKLSIKRIREFFEDNNIQVKGTFATRCDIHDTPASTLTSGGPKAEEQFVPCLYSSETAALDAFEFSLLKWLNGRRFVYLRAEPRVESVKLYQDFLHGNYTELIYYFVYCRLTAY